MIGVIGAGPAGCYYSSLADDDVLLFEEHKKIGEPVSCTGIVTDSIKRVIDVPKELIVSKIHTFRLIAPNGKKLDIKLDKENIVMDRAKFDRFMLQKALDNGVKLKTGHKFIDYKEENNKIKIKTNKGDFLVDFLVGADGPRSLVAQKSGLYGKREFLEGLQARVKYKGTPGVTEIRLGLGEFAWIVPEDENIARVGVIGRDVKNDYKTLLNDCKIIEDQSGLVPLYNPKQKLRKKNVFLIGDAATQVKATTYGGIIYGLLAGKYLAENPETYESVFNAKLGKDLWMSLKMRQAMNSMTENQYSELIAIFNKENNKKILAEYDRDFPTKFIVQLLMKETNLWKLGFSVVAKNMFSK
ncbi:geranylgeranyl reductase family protein [Candidatus Woesearchaeota archaeon]|nr:geranylgeranyl reductase family protein [Candidatus Woesearchaeota archaeon]